MRPSRIRMVFASPLLAATVWGLHACSSEAPDTTPPAQVTDLRVEAFTETTAVLVWTAPGNDGDRGQAAQYDLRVAAGTPAVDWSEAAIADAALAPPGKPGAVDRAPVRGLAFGQVYHFALRTADGDANWSVFSNVARVETGDPAPPARVTDLRAADLAPHAVTLVFTAPGDDSLSGWAEEYALRMSASPITEATWGQAEPIVLTDPPQTARSQEHIRITTLHPATTIHLAIRARDDAGRWGAVSNDLEVTLPVDTVPPGMITDLQVVETGPYTATLRWTAPGNDGDEARVDGYEIRRAETRIQDEGSWEAGTPVGIELEVVEPGEVQTAVLAGLPGPKTLWFAVRARDAANNRGEISNGVSGFVERAPRAWAVRVDGSGQAPTIQAAIDSASAGDSVLVHAGTYCESITYRGKAIKVMSVAGPLETTIVGSGALATAGADPVVLFATAETQASSLEGFTITGGGPGIKVLDAEATIAGNIIEGNHITSIGAAIDCDSRDQGPPLFPIIRGNVIQGNRSEGTAGGILTWGRMLPQITDNIIRNNIAAHGDGGGIYCFTWVTVKTGTVTISNNLIVENEAWDHGGGIYFGSNALHGWEISGNVVTRNVAYGNGWTGNAGGGIWVEKTDSVIHNNTIVLNRAYGMDWEQGGGLVINLVGNQRIERNIIAFSTVGGGIWCGGGATPVIRDNLAWKNAQGDGVGSCSDWWQSNGNIVADPLFCNRAGGDYSLTAGSPALTHPAGPLGAIPAEGCQPTLVERTTWGSIKARYGMR